MKFDTIPDIVPQLRTFHIEVAYFFNKTIMTWQKLNLITFIIRMAYKNEQTVHE